MITEEEKAFDHLDVLVSPPVVVLSEKGERGYENDKFRQLSLRMNPQGGPDPTESRWQVAPCMAIIDDD
jgi:hypothetical protein